MSSFHGLLEFGEFQTCGANEGCAHMLSQYKKVYGKYIEQHRELENVKYTLKVREETTIPTLQVDINRLKDCLEREKAEISILERREFASHGSEVCYGSIEMLTRPCARPECVEKRDLLDMLRKRCAHNTDRTLEDMRLVREKLEELEKEAQFLQSRVSYFHTISMKKKDLFWRDEEVAMLRRQLEDRMNPLATKLNSDISMFKNLDAEVLALRQMHANRSAEQREEGIPPVSVYPSNAHMTEGYVTLMDHKEVVGQMTARLCSMDTNYSVEMHQLKEKTESERRQLANELAVLKRENAKLASRYAALERQHDELNQSAMKRTILKAVIDDGSEFERDFRAFFTLVDEGEVCYDENTLYDSFFHQRSREQRHAYIEWMYGCCHHGAALSNRLKRDLHADERRTGKKLFAACLWAIGGIYKNFFNGHWYVWINVSIERKNIVSDPSLKRRKRLDAEQAI